MSQMTFKTNMPWAVYQCQKLGRGETPKDEVAISAHLTASEAMDEANRLARSDRKHTYMVGGA